MSNTRVHRKGEKTVVYMGGQQLHGSGSNIVISCGQGPSRSRGTVFRMPNEGAGSVTTETGVPSCLPGCRTTVSLENMPSSSEPKIVRVVPRGTTILLEEVKAPPKAQSGRSKSGVGTPTIQVVEECVGGVENDPPPPRPEPVPVEHCIECLAELIQRRRSKRRSDLGSRSQRKVVAKVTAEVSEEDEGQEDDGADLPCCPNCGGPLTPVAPK